MQTFTKITSIYTYYSAKVVPKRTMKHRIRRKNRKPALEFLFNFNTGTGTAGTGKWDLDPTAGTSCSSQSKYGGLLISVIE